MRLDLNLLRPLNALLQTASVTVAAQRVGLSQPACSSALGRLRRHFDDPLLVRVPGRGMQLTPLAERLRERIAVLVDDIDTVLMASNTIDVRTLDREFSILISDAEAEIVLPALIARMSVEAPLARLRIDSPTNAMGSDLGDEVRRHDTLVLPAAAIPSGVHTAELYEEEWTCIVDADHDGATGLSLADARKRSWAVCYDLPTMAWSPARLLEDAGLLPNLSVRTEGFLELFSIVAGTQLTALAPRRLAEIRCPTSKTRWVTAPTEIGGRFSISMAWSPIYTLDPAHQWLRSLIIAATAR
ncbi:LysR family transcriptional regulator [Rhodococcus fascians]|nr:LysR family transcriptional regulator [Rhodococcus fascians]MBY4114572.1 LysR family transcriptional regulator [Rhodococcus fascians]